MKNVSDRVGPASALEILQLVEMFFSHPDVSQYYGAITKVGVFGILLIAFPLLQHYFKPVLISAKRGSRILCGAMVTSSGYLTLYAESQTSTPALADRVMLLRELRALMCARPLAAITARRSLAAVLTRHGFQQRRVYWLSTFAWGPFTYSILSTRCYSGTRVSSTLMHEYIHTPGDEFNG